MKKYTLPLLLLSSISTVSAYANEKKVQHDAHEHGIAEMNIIWEKDTLNIEIETPAFNIVGFEYQPSTHEQEESIAKIEAKLNKATELFAITGASCQLTKAHIESPFEGHDEHDDHKDHDSHDKHAEHDDHKDHDSHDKHAKHDDHKDHDSHDKHAEHDDHKEHESHDKHAEHDDHKDHDSHDKHAEHDDHKDHAHEEGGESSTHSEYNISYNFTCTNSEKELSVSSAELFAYFPNMEKIKVQWLSSTQQSSSVLSKANNTVTLK